MPILYFKKITMNTGLVVTGVLIVLLCVLFFIIVRKNKQKKEREFKALISSLAGESNCKIDVYDRWNNTMIGMDNLNRKLFFLRNAGDKAIRMMVDLSDIQMGSVVNSRWNNKGESYNATQKIELGLTSKERGKPQTLLEFYNAEYDSLTIMDELLLAEKWSKLINSTIQNSIT